AAGTALHRRRTMSAHGDLTWTDVCALDALVPERGAAALVEGHQVALFPLADDSVPAGQQRDPVSGANVVSPGLVGTVGDVPAVTSPMHKQVWALATGECLDAAGKEPQDLRSYPVEVRDGVVRVAVS